MHPIHQRLLKRGIAWHSVEQQADGARSRGAWIEPMPCWWEHVAGRRPDWPHAAHPGSHALQAVHHATIGVDQDDIAAPAHQLDHERCLDDLRRQVLFRVVDCAISVGLIVAAMMGPKPLGHLQPHDSLERRLVDVQQGGAAHVLAQQE